MSEDAAPDVSVVVPLFRAERSLKILHRRLAQTLGSRLSWELVLVDDASPDGTRQVAQRLAGEDHRVFYRRLDRNRGQHYATVYGLRHSRGQRVVTMDDDLEHAPEDILRLLAPLDSGYLVAIARFEGKTHAWYRRAGSWLAGCLWRWSQGAGDLRISSFKALDRRAVDRLLACPQIIRGPLSMHILDALPRSALTNVTVAHRPRLHGHSNYSVSMLLAEMVKIARRGALRIGPRPGRPGDLGNGRPPADSA